MRREEHIAFTVTFTEKEYYIMSKLISAQGQTPEDYIHDCVTGLFGRDIDCSFGIGTTMYEELHKLNDSPEELNAG